MSKKEFREVVFPQGFLWGAATSAHQVEGNNTNNHWWVWEQEGGHIHDGSVSGRACDHYNLYEQDFELVRELGHNVHRFSIEWSRIEPKEGLWNEKEIEHYRNVVEALLERKITPMVTLHHFTNPIWMQDKGGWLNPKSVDLFERYTRTVVETLGDVITFYNTINEPMMVAVMGYLLGIHPPCKTDLAEFFTVGKHLLMAHGKCYRAIHETVRDRGFKIKPQVGIVKQIPYFAPYNPHLEEDVKQAKLMDDIVNRWYLDGIHTGTVAPPFGGGEKLDYLENSWDFIGVNWYTRILANSTIKLEAEQKTLPQTVPEGAEITDMGWEVYPEGFYHSLMSVKKYKKPVYVTENGIATLNDEQRCRYIIRHLYQLHRAIHDGLDVKGYMYWSLMDNFEWAEGFAKRFGIVEVNYNTLERKPRPSAYLYRDIIKRNAITEQQLQKYSASP
ncbi:MAG: family 1 glycosylhydrolase [Candidatus Freyarchaeota archaeon]|nr:family 1 glycosylhydrolase [Candidatus Jordarchaeia archaeon]MBS7280246.1 family 1 glycosylhydrolase [Candidatus Jordarchaeia archaeon]